MISVIIPLYNKEAIIERSLQSVLSQNFDDFEVIVVNDGSTDKSMEVVQSISDSRLRLINQENGGPSKARNTGIKAAKGEWIVFLDADDELLPGALMQCVNILMKTPNCGLVAFPYYNFDGETRTIVDNKIKGLVKQPFKSFFFREINPRMGSYLISKKTALSCLFNESIRRFEDDEHIFRIFRELEKKPCKTIIYGYEPSMISNTGYAAASHGRQNIEEDFLGHLEFTGKSFWEKMCLYRLFIEERLHYSEQCRKMYPKLYIRCDLFIIYKFLLRFSPLFIR